MRSFLFLFLCVLLALSFAVPAFALEENAAKNTVSISLTNTVAEYSPYGHRPTADAGTFSSELRYEVTENESGMPVPLPIMDVGSYTVRAYIQETATHGSAEAIANFTVTPAKVYLSVPNQSVAHTAMANPVRYSVSPAWAAGMLDVKISYRAINSLSDKGTEVEVPVDMGSYLVYMDATPLNEKVECAGKYLIYTVGEAYGGPVTEEKALLSVPKEFKATVETLDADYTGEPVVPQWSANVSAAECTLMFSRIYADGTSSAYTKTPPTDPGDYIAACFVLDTVIGSSRLVINKMVAKINMEDRVYTYNPQGIEIEEAVTEPAGILLKYSAYKYVNGQMGAAVEFPLVECGTYLISAAPQDTYRYSYTESVSYCYITVEKATPIIEGNDVLAVEDGKFKGVSVSVQPDYADYSVSYYKVQDNSASPVTGVPSKAGTYYAVVTVKEDARLNSATAVYGVVIQSAVDENSLFAREIIKWLCFLFCTCGVGVALYHIILVKLVRRR